MKLLTVFLFIHCFVFGQVEKNIDYNIDHEKLYECLNIKPFQNSKYDYHIRLNIQYSIIVDIMKNEKETKGYVYHYIYQDEKQLVNRELQETNTYIHKVDTLNTTVINQFIHHIDSIILVDSIDLNPRSKFSCGRIQPVVNIQKKDTNHFELRRVHISHIDSLLLNTNIKRLEVSTWPYGYYFGIGGSAMGCFHANPLRITFSGVSAQYASREKQNIDLFSNWGSDFEMRNNHTFNYQWLGGSYPENIYKITTIQN